MIADFRDANQSKNIRDKVANQINIKWEETYNQGNLILTSVLPPEDEGVSKYICPKYHKKINTDPKMSKAVVGKGLMKSEETQMKRTSEINLREDQSKKSVKFEATNTK